MPMTQSLHAEEPPTAYWPLAHAVHCAALYTPLKRPVPQLMQTPLELR